MVMVGDGRVVSPAGGGNSKRPRDDASEPPRYGVGKGLFTYGTNRQGGVSSFWDASDFDIAHQKSRSLVSAYDVTRLFFLTIPLVDFFVARRLG
ncbi:UNVERIFIED_CONTAM: hypothetical protein Sradi_1755900 [Sesamum radiatum]|uniref:Uncharacterized protein n=1 Tax=Sesamum radiatum TaxID=300843 RepID=A0AAW2TTK7_SESRA